MSNAEASTETTAAAAGAETTVATLVLLSAAPPTRRHPPLVSLETRSNNNSSNIRPALVVSIASLEIKPISAFPIAPSSDPSATNSRSSRETASGAAGCELGDSLFFNIIS